MILSRPYLSNDEKLLQSVVCAVRRKLSVYPIDQLDLEVVVKYQNELSIGTKLTAEKIFNDNSSTKLTRSFTRSSDLIRDSCNNLKVNLDPNRLCKTRHGVIEPYKDSKHDETNIFGMMPLSSYDSYVNTGEKSKSPSQKEDSFIDSESRAFTFAETVKITGGLMQQTMIDLPSY